MRMILCTALVALVAVPVALAKPPHALPAQATAAATTTTIAHGKAGQVLFVLRGTLGAYTAATTSSNGSIAITVTGSNHQSSLLKGTTVTLPVGVGTKVVGTVTSGDLGIVKIRAAKNASVATLTGTAAVQVIDQGSGTD